jgi:uncharacterized protein (TIGR03083 family)
MDLSPHQLLRMAFDATAADGAAPPEGLEARVLAAALDGAKPVRHPAWADADAATMSPLDAFGATAAELAELLDSLDPADWARPTRLDGVTVRGLVEHLVGVERYVLGQLGRRRRRDAPRREDHWPVTRLAAADVAGAPDGVVARTWWLEALAFVAACGELGPERAMAFHDLAGSLRGMLVVRTFELWTHGDDIRHAVGRPPDLLDEPRLSLMVGELMRMLPMGLALSGCPQTGRTARFVLSGPGGGRFDVALAPDEVPGHPDVVIRADTIGLCRLAANRIAPDRFDVRVDGDASLLGPVLVGASAFAAD